jgi:hypothetical protein
VVDENMAPGETSDEESDDEEVPTTSKGASKTRKAANQAKPKPKRQAKSKRAGLTFPVTRVKKGLKSLSRVERVSESRHETI